MLGITLGEAKTVGTLVVVGLVVAAGAVTWIMKEIMKKVVLAAMLLLLALVVWSQRSSLQECADKVRTVGFNGETTCSFLGQDVNVGTGTKSS